MAQENNVSASGAILYRLEISLENMKDKFSTEVKTMKTKKAFREFLNQQNLDHINNPLRPDYVSTQFKGAGNRGQRVRLYRDYLYSADREMFNFEFENWKKVA